MSRNLPLAFLILLLLVLIGNFVLIAPYILALFLGWILATVLKPFFGILRARKVEAHVAALVSVFVAMIAVILPVGLLGLSLVRNLNRVINEVMRNGVTLQGLEQKMYAWPLISRIFESEADLNAFWVEYTQKIIAGVGQFLSLTLSGLPSLMLQTVLALLAAYYILLEGGRFRAFIAPRVPLLESTQERLLKGLTDTAYSGFLSMMAAASVQALVVFVGFLVLGVPMAGLALGLAFVSAWIPIVGVTPVWLSAGLYLVIQQRYGAAIGMLIFGVAAGLVDNVVRPWVLKGRNDLHPLLSLISIFGGVYYFGIMGVLVGPVALACAIEFLTLWPEFADELGLSKK